MKKFRPMPDKLRRNVSYEVKMMIAAHRGLLWHQWETCSHAKAVDPHEWQLVANDANYGEAFGVMRGLNCAGYGYFGSDNLDAVSEYRSDVPEHNLKWWFTKLVREYLDEEGFFEKSCSMERCKELLQKYRNLVRK